DMPDVGRALRRLVAARAGRCCEYCRSQEDFSHDPFSVEHILPHAAGGGDDLANLAYSCQGCNGRKYTAIEAPDPLTGEPAPLFHPRQHLWTEHFTWDQSCTHVLGITPTGRATIARLELNRRQLTNYRRVMRSAGEHPPER